MRVAVHDDAVAILGKSFALGVSGGSERQSPDDLRLILAQVVERRDRRLRHEQHVHRRLWRDVAEGDQVFVLEHDVGGDFAANDLAEESGVGHGLSFLVKIHVP
jgi:hypothetical protein